MRRSRTVSTCRKSVATTAVGPPAYSGGDPFQDLEGRDSRVPRGVAVEVPGDAPSGSMGPAVLLPSRPPGRRARPERGRPTRIPGTPRTRIVDRELIVHPPPSATAGPGQPRTA